MGLNSINARLATPEKLPPLPWNLEKAAVVVEKLSRSGLSIAAFAARHRVEAHHVYHWRKRLHQHQGASKHAEKFVPVRLISKPAETRFDEGAGIDIVTDQGCIVRIRGSVDEEQLSHVLRAIGGLRC